MSPIFQFVNMRYKISKRYIYIWKDSPWNDDCHRNLVHMNWNHRGKDHYRSSFSTHLTNGILNLQNWKTSKLISKVRLNAFLDNGAGVLLAGENSTSTMTRRKSTKTNVLVSFVLGKLFLPFSQLSHFTYKLSRTLLNNPWVKKEITNDIRKYL